MTIQHSRRRFLRTAAMSAAPLLAAQGVFARELAQIDFPVGQKLDWKLLSAQYSLDSSVTYLNHASIGTMPRVVADAYSRYLTVCEQNPWSHMWGGEWDDPRQQVRTALSSRLGCSASEVAITHNTTEMFNVLAQGLPLKGGDEVLFSSLNHPGASVAFEHAGKARGYSVRQFDFPLHDAASMSADQLVQCYVEQVRDSTRVLVFPHIDNILGIRYPVAALARAARKKGVEFIAVDGAQSAGMIGLDLSQLGVDVYATSPHKWWQAPKGLGVAYVSQALQSRLAPMWVTWGQAGWSDSARKYEDYGTRNLAGVVALGDALAFHQQIDNQTREQRLQALQQSTRECVEAHSKTQWLSPTDPALGSAIASFQINGENSKGLAKRLFAENRIVFRAFTHQGLNSVRLSPNLANQKREIAQVFRLL